VAALGSSTGSSPRAHAAVDAPQPPNAGKWPTPWPIHEDLRVPGLGIAIVQEGRLVYDEAFGFADIAARTTLTPTHRFRIASISKPITSVAIFKLIETGKLALSDRVFGPLASCRTTTDR